MSGVKPRDRQIGRRNTIIARQYLFGGEPRRLQQPFQLSDQIFAGMDMVALLIAGPGIDSPAIGLLLIQRLRHSKP